MKHIKLASAIAVIMGIAFAGSAVAANNSGTITFTGAVNDVTCTVKGGSGSDGGTGDFVVGLTPADASQLAAAGDIANPKRFDVQIGGPGQGTCTDGKIGAMSFETASPQIDAATGALRNVLAGEATNVQVQLADAAGTVINLADPSFSVPFTIDANNTAIIPYTAQYLAVNGAATPGLVRTDVLYKVVYN
ncbi:fimbrial protein [Dyella koreensis]|uniref:Type 1 fimbrial protein n=1 Tax=Dyella koreensis TaxID=311235 RepID=A0ABW8KAF0_9GAMM